MTRLVILLLLPLLCHAKVCCQGWLSEVQTNDTCPSSVFSIEPERVECATLCCSVWVTGVHSKMVVSRCVPNLISWIQDVRTSNDYNKAHGYTGSFGEECLIYDTTNTTNTTNSHAHRTGSCLSLVTLSIITSIFLG